MSLPPKTTKPRKEASIHWNVKTSERGPSIHFVVQSAHIFDTESDARTWAAQAAYALRDTAARLEQNRQPTPEEIELSADMRDAILSLDHEGILRMRDRIVALYRADSESAGAPDPQCRLFL